MTLPKISLARIIETIAIAFLVVFSVKAFIFSDKSVEKLKESLVQDSIVYVTVQDTVKIIELQKALKAMEQRKNHYKKLAK